MKIRMGELLVRAGVITDSQLRTALKEQRQWGGRIGDILVRMQYVTEDVFVRALSKQTGIPRADLSAVSPEAVARLPGDVAQEFEVIPVAVQDEGRTLVVATADPLNVNMLDQLRVLTGCRLVAHVAGASAIRDAVARWYGGDEPRDETPGPDARPADVQLRPLPAEGSAPVPRAAASPLATPLPPPGLAGFVPAPAYAPAAVPPPAFPFPYIGTAIAGAAAEPAAAPVAPAAPLPVAATPLPVAATPLPVPPVSPAPVPYIGSAAVPEQTMPWAGPAARPAANGAAWPWPLVPPRPALPEERLAAMEDAQRREAAALRTLVEMLAEAGIFRLEDFMARLRR